MSRYGDGVGVESRRDRLDCADSVITAYAWIHHDPYENASGTSPWIPDFAGVTAGFRSLEPKSLPLVSGVKFWGWRIDNVRIARVYAFPVHDRGTRCGTHLAAEHDVHAPL